MPETQYSQCHKKQTPHPNPERDSSEGSNIKICEGTSGKLWCVERLQFLYEAGDSAQLGDKPPHPY